VNQIPWNDLPFWGFTEEQLKQRPFWENAARDVIQLETNGEKIGVVADTGAGKTIIALLVTLQAAGDRVLFLVPQRILADQHRDLLLRITGGTAKSRVITGETLCKNRVWNDDKDSVVFATPQVIQSTMRSSPSMLCNFRRIIFDEFHKASGKYPYVPIAKIATDLKLAILALSASPGTNESKIESVMRSCGVTRLLRVDWLNAPKRIESLIQAEPDQKLVEIDNLFNVLLEESTEKLEEVFESLNYKLERSNGYIAESKIQEAEKYLQALGQKTPAYFTAVSFIAEYNKLRHGHKILLTEGYEIFDAYISERIELDHSLAARSIRGNGVFKEIVKLVREPHDEHPKVAKLIELLESMHRMSWRGIIFVAFKKTAFCLQQKLAKIGLKTEVLFGGKDKNVRRQKEILERLRKEQISFIISTSVIEEGIAVPEVKAVIHYSMPQNSISRIQRSGRTARVQPGNVVYVALNHYLDIARYWSTKTGVRKMKELIGAQPPRIKSPHRKKNKNREDKSQFLFGFMSQAAYG